MAAYKRLFNVFASAISPQLNNYLPRPNLQCCRGYATGKIRNVEKKLGIPARPKRPLTPFFQFCRSKRPELVKEYPNFNIPQMTKKLAECWKACDIKTKEEHRQKYLNELENYSKESILYEQSLSPEHKQMIADERLKVKKRIDKREKKTMMSDLGKPKRPPTAFILFTLSKKAAQTSSGSKYSDWLPIIAKEWSSISPEEKKKFEVESAKLMEQYKIEIIEWEKKMINEGNIELVRKESLINIRGKKSRSSKTQTPPQTEPKTA